MSNEVVVSEMSRIVVELQAQLTFVQKNMAAFEQFNNNTSVSQKMTMDLVKTLNLVQKVQNEVQSVSTGVFLYTPKDKLQL